jgi:hypothetical protein
MSKLGRALLMQMGITIVSMIMVFIGYQASQYFNPQPNSALPSAGELRAAASAQPDLSGAVPLVSAAASGAEPLVHEDV